MRLTHLYSIRGARYGCVDLHRAVPGVAGSFDVQDALQIDGIRRFRLQFRRKLDCVVRFGQASRKLYCKTCDIYLTAEWSWQ